ncbi:MAG: hypothetical protein K2P58_00530 [Hyphomonadaceae bacterium]|nr:hypothetical protein [Hyphomonadaceae bacterium]
MLSKTIAGIMIVSGLLTLTMLYAAISPSAAIQQMFQETPTGAMAAVVVPNWGALIGLMGALLIFGAFNPSSRRLALAVASASKLAFVGLVLAQGERYLSGVGIAVAIDSVMVVLFAVFLFLSKPAA